MKGLTKVPRQCSYFWLLGVNSWSWLVRVHPSITLLDLGHILNLGVGNYKSLFGKSSVPHWKIGLVKAIRHPFYSLPSSGEIFRKFAETAWLAFCMASYTGLNLTTFVRFKLLQIIFRTHSKSDDMSVLPLHPVIRRCHLSSSKEHFLRPAKNQTASVPLIQPINLNHNDKRNALVLQIWAMLTLVRQEIIQLQSEFTSSWH